MSENAYLGELDNRKLNFFSHHFNDVQSLVHQMARDKGWYDEGERNLGELISLIHSEASECLEALRHGNPPSNHIAPFSAAEEELADVIVRVMDLAEYQGWHIGKAITAKIKFNATRPNRHGGKLF